MTTVAVAPRAPAPAAPPQRPPNRLALSITGRNYVSYSQLSLMRSCPKKFELSYVLKAPKDFIPVSLVYGGSVHAALEVYYRARLEGLTLSAEEMLLAYHAAWRRNLQDAGEKVLIKFGAKEDEPAVHALAQRTIAAFLASPLATPKGSILGIEEELKVVLHPDLPDVLTRVDLVTNSAAALYVTDFKTSRSRWTPEKAHEASDQLILYASATAGMARGMNLPVKLAFAVLTKAKTPIVQILPVPTDTSRVAAMTTAALQTWSAIRAGNFYPNPGPMTCSTCPFKSRCPAFAGR
jgi:hypothetical protein